MCVPYYHIINIHIKKKSLKKNQLQTVQYMRDKSTSDFTEFYSMISFHMSTNHDLSRLNYILNKENCALKIYMSAIYVFNTSILTRNIYIYKKTPTYINTEQTI